MNVKAKNYMKITIQEELTNLGEWLDGVLYTLDGIEIRYNDKRASDFYSMKQGEMNLGEILLAAFGDNDIKITDTETTRIFSLV